MKRKTLFKAIAICIVAYMLLTWFIPTGYFSNGVYTKKDIVPLGLFDLIRYPIITFTTPVFLLAGGVIILVGIFYSVLNKTGAYQTFVDRVVKKFKDKKQTFLVITTITFLVLSSLTGVDLALFVLVPFFATVIMLLGYGKISAMLATIGSIIAGNLASTYGFNIAGYISYYTNDINDSIWYRVGLFVAIMAIMLLAVIKTSKAKEKVSADEIMLYEKTTTKSKKSATPMIIIFVVCFLIAIVGMINWSEVFNLNIFDEGYKNIANAKLFNYPVGKAVFGEMYGYGAWTNYELAMMLGVCTLLISLVYKLKVNDIVACVKKGVKKMMPAVFYLGMANIIFLMLNTTPSGYTIFPTIAHTILNVVEGFNVFIYSVAVFIASFFYNDFPYMLGALYDPTANLYADNLSIIGLISQGIYGIVQFVAPTSVLLVVGLNYFDIPYGTWFKKVFKYLLLILAALVIALIIMALI